MTKTSSELSALAQELIEQLNLPDPIPEEKEKILALTAAAHVLHSNHHFFAICVKTVWQTGFLAGREDARLDKFRED